MSPGSTPNNKRFCVLNPGSTFCRFRSVRTNSPAPTSSNNDNDTCNTTRPRLRSERWTALDPRPPSFSVGAKCTFVARHAGATPKTIPVKNDNPMVKTRTRQLSDGSNARMPRPPQSLTASKPFFIQNAKRIPSRPPTTESRTLSVNNCLIKRQRLAPRAKRKLISFWRDAARDNRRFATFAHAINSTRPTTPSRR